jgi:hypothetical protein
VAAGYGLGTLTFGFFNATDPAPTSFLPGASRTVVPAEVNNTGWTTFTVAVDTFDINDGLDDKPIGIAVKWTGGKLPCRDGYLVAMHHLIFC